MKMRIASLALLTILCLALSTPAFAAGFVYSNGPIKGTVSAYYICCGTGFEVSNSFTVSVNSTMTGFTFGEWVLAGDLPTGISWAVGTTSFGGTLTPGGGFSTTLLCTNGSPYNGGICGGGFGYDVYESFATTGAIFLAAGTHYLTLAFATDSGGTGFDGWDINAGNSTAFCRPPACPTLSPQGDDQIPSESFTILGAATGTTPEPSSIMLFGSGILGLVGVLRRKLNIHL
jgi:hypothetical protein